MDKHLLVTVGDDQTALYGARFLGMFYEHKDDLKLTLYFTSGRPLAPECGSLDRTAIKEVERLYKERSRQAEQATDAACKRLFQMGFQEDQVDTKLKFRRHSKAHDIAGEAEAGLYDAVVLGRRGVSWLEEAMGESVSREVLDKSFQCPVWICRMPEEGRKNLLLCVDGSEQSDRIVDHAGFMVASEERHKITLLHVARGGNAEQESAAIFSRAREALLANGVAESRIREVVQHQDNVAKAILKEAANGKYAAVGVGRTGEGKSFLKRLFMGSVSMTLFRELTGAALWVVQ